METPCIAMVASVNGPRQVAGPVIKGRPAIKFKGKNWKVGRLSYHLNVAKLPRTPRTLKRGITCHKCDNAWCINQSHIYLGTARQNTTDIFARNKFIRERMAKAGIGNQKAKGYKFTKKQREYLSQKLIGNQRAKGYKFTPEQRARAAKAAKLRCTPEFRAKITKSLKGNRRAHDAWVRRKAQCKS